ncbi:MAG: diguanylate cyclase [Deltaproteobacteria bacterium]|nr:diguanylate cyclase [Deltaproteobacteria bacterium]
MEKEPNTTLHNLKKSLEAGALPPSLETLLAEKLRVGIIGLGRGGKAILEIFKDDPFVEVIGVADNNPDALAAEIAKKLKVSIFKDFRKLLKRDMDIIINVTGSQAVKDDIRKLKPANIEVIEGLSARLLWQLVEERRRSAEDRERVLKEHESLYHLGLIIENIGSMKDAGYALVDYATKLTSTPAGSLAIFDERKEDMVLVAAKGFSSSFKKLRRWEIRKGGLTNFILNQSSPVVIQTDSLAKGLSLNPVLKKEAVTSLLAAPLTIEGRIVGIIYVNDFKKRQFRSEDISLFSLLCIYAALTIERVKSIEEMRLLSITDGLTGLYNHRFLMENMQKEIQRAVRHEGSFSILMLDIDHFKGYNDSYGHLEGNRVLKGIARVLLNTARATDTVGRFGGEEFCVIVHDMKKDGAIAFANRIITAIDEYKAPHRKVTLSGGIAAYPADGTSPHELISKADSCLYRAKKEGRNRIYF